MRALTQQEVAATWLYHDQFAALGLGAIEFYRRLRPFEKNRVNEMIRDILEAETALVECADALARRRVIGPLPAQTRWMYDPALFADGNRVADAGHLSPVERGDA